MLFFVDQVTERLQFTLEFVFRQHGIHFELTNDLSIFEAETGFKCSYSDYPFQSVKTILPSDLLFEDHIRDNPRLEIGTWNGVDCLSIDGKTDPIAAIFFLISRYEEYLPGVRDKHDRFSSKNSFLHKFGWLEKPIAEYWIEALYNFLDPERKQLCPEKKVTVIPSFDIDNTFAFKWKDGWRFLLSELKDRFKGNNQRRELRKNVRSGMCKDPFDTFEEIERCAGLFPETRVFWLLADWGEFDRNITWKDPRHQRLIRTISRMAKVGLHPGYASNLSDKRLSEEKQRIELIIGEPVRESRQHFLKVRLPQTYNRLINEGFRRDFSMGFADAPGFRLGTARPVYFFDLGHNCQTDFQLMPFVYMDGTFNEYLGCSVEEAKANVLSLYKEVQQFGGVFCFIWHNETIGESGKWKGWSELYRSTLELVSSRHD